MVRRGPRRGTQSREDDSDGKGDRRGWAEERGATPTGQFLEGVQRERKAWPNLGGVCSRDPSIQAHRLLPTSPLLFYFILENA